MLQDTIDIDMLNSCKQAKLLLKTRTWMLFDRPISPKQQLSDYVFPEIKNEDCQQKYISGWGPGGQKVNKAQNAVMLKHIPTGVTVKVHESRSLHENIKIAFERLKLAVDREINGANCYEEQLRKLQREKEERKNRKKAAKKKMIERLKEEAAKMCSKGFGWEILSFICIT